MIEKPYEVWVSNEIRCQSHSVTWRFNARFANRDKALGEVAWYAKHSYYAEIRYEGEIDYSDGVLEFPEGSGG